MELVQEDPGESVRDTPVEVALGTGPFGVLGNSFCLPQKWVIAAGSGVPSRVRTQSPDR
ncbi:MULTISPECIES: hypothetical protein [Streptomyces]|uniref:hypothetical protein n=1 Tax=Streptomyces TaxID=1883 RepID=UPI001428A12F|nr:MULTISPECIES: hypothetical protein [Streptomyces]